MKEMIKLKDKKLKYTPISQQEADEAKSSVERITANIEQVIKGKHEQVLLVVLCMLAEGHVLIEDIPGTGKTSLVSALAKTMGCGFKRIQFTPDVMPSDISGFSIYNQKSGEFEFRPGAAMSNIVLADEINRASAKTQSAMLEIMEERQVTVDGNTYKMEKPFMVLATQNPVDSLGTYRLPEAQIDRFMIKISLGYPEFEDELTVVMDGKQAKEEIADIVDGTLINRLVEQTNRVVVDRTIGSYIVHIAEATRRHPDVKLGSSPRGSIALYAIARAYALSQGRCYVTPDDVKYLAPYVLSHRLILTHEAKTEKKDPHDVINTILNQVVVPVNGRQQP